MGRKKLLKKALVSEGRELMVASVCTSCTSPSIVFHHLSIPSITVTNNPSA